MKALSKAFLVVCCLTSAAHFNRYLLGSLLSPQLQCNCSKGLKALDWALLPSPDFTGCENLGKDTTTCLLIVENIK
jgi:hypothetical protein